MAYLLAHDLGTSGNKAALFAPDGALVATASVSYSTHYPHEGWVEQEPEDWWRAVVDSTRQLLAQAAIVPGEIACVAVSGTMMACLLVDQDLDPLGRCIIWADTRAGKEQAWMEQVAGVERGYAITGHRLSASYSAAKLLWIKQHQPDLYRQAAKLLNPKDFIVARLTGVVATDFSDASSTNLLDLKALRWSDDLAHDFGIDKALLPELRAAADVAGHVSAAAADQTGLLQGTPVAMGGGDGSCACVGAGVVAKGSAYNVIGTSSWISAVSDQPLFDPAMRTFTWVHLNPTLYTPCGTMQAAGYSYGWYRETFFGSFGSGTEADALLSGHLDSTEPGAGGVLFLPYLLGERSPLWDHNARAAFIGMGASTTAANMSRAVVEGISFALKSILVVLDQAFPVDKVQVIGGGAVNAAWMRILAEVLGRPLAVLSTPAIATARGAAIAGGVAVGLYPNYAVAKDLAQVEQTVIPTGDGAKAYAKSEKAFNHAYTALAPVFAELAVQTD